MKRNIYVIVEYDYLRGGYKSCAVNGLYFQDKKCAQNYMKTIPFNSNCEIEKLNVFEVEK